MPSTEEILDAPERFKEKGIRFQLAKLEDEEQIWKFLNEEFMPDEPIFR